MFHRVAYVLAMKQQAQSTTRAGELQENYQIFLRLFFVRCLDESLGEVFVNHRASPSGNEPNFGWTETYCLRTSRAVFPHSPVKTKLSSALRARG